MTVQVSQLCEAIRRPLPLDYHPLYRLYEGGSLTRTFRGLPARQDDNWSEDWVGSCTQAGNDDPLGRPQGLSPVCAPILAAAREEVMRQYGGAVGRCREELITPALVPDVDAAQRNIDQMAAGAHLTGLGGQGGRPGLG